MALLFPRIVWLLWLQGWSTDIAPPLAVLVAQSYKVHNPGWDVRHVSAANLHLYLDDNVLAQTYYNVTSPAFTRQARSDYIRIALLATYGGVWADASMVCFYPLDDWLPTALYAVDFWTYHARDRGRGPATWFIVSKKQAYITTTWLKAIVHYWQAFPDNPRGYTWMDDLFGELARTDTMFRRQWQATAWIDANSAISAHYAMVSGDPDVLHTLQTKQTPYVLKLRFYDDQRLPNYLAIANWSCTVPIRDTPRETFQKPPARFYDGAIYYP